MITSMILITKKSLFIISNIRPKGLGLFLLRFPLSSLLLSKLFESLIEPSRLIEEHFKNVNLINEFYYYIVKSIEIGVKKQRNRLKFLVNIKMNI